MKEYTVLSAEETEVLARTLGEKLIASGRRRLFIAFFGEMGVGKTTFTRGFASATSPQSVTRSPTYSVVNEYRGGDLPIFHFDMYRIEDEEDLASIGYDDYLARDGFVLCEWSERIRSELPEDVLSVTILRTDAECGRRILMEGEGYEDIMP